MVKLVISPYYKKALYYASLVCFLCLVVASHWLSQLHGELWQNGGISSALGSSTLGFGDLVVLQFSLLALFMLFAWYFQPTLLKQPSRQSNLLLLLSVAVVARLVLLGVEPYTSNDVDRYLFDGRIALAGLDPYSISHNANELIELRALWQPPAEHAAYPTLYPPLALALFAFAASFGVEHAQWIWQFMVTIASIVSVFLAFSVLKKANKLQHFPLIALSPILILEAGVGLHLDAFSTLFIAIAVYAWQRKYFYFFGLAIGLGTLTKILPLVLLLPLCLVRFSWLRALTLTNSALLVIAFGYGLTFFLGFYPVGSIGTFFEKWRFASPLFTFLGTVDNQLFISILLVFTLLLIAMVSYFAINQNSLKLKSQLVTACQLALAIPLIISPVLFSWYLMPMVILIALRPNIYLILWLITMPLTYQVLNGFVCCHIWQPASWPVLLLAIIYGSALLNGFYLLFKSLKQVPINYLYVGNNGSKGSQC